LKLRLDSMDDSRRGSNRPGCKWKSVCFSQQNLSATAVPAQPAPELQCPARAARQEQYRLSAPQMGCALAGDVSVGIGWHGHQYLTGVV
jgi:hypothetical protein